MPMFLGEEGERETERERERERVRGGISALLLYIALVTMHIIQLK